VFRHEGVHVLLQNRYKSLHPRRRLCSLCLFCIGANSFRNLCTCDFSNFSKPKSIKNIPKSIFCPDACLGIFVRNLQRQKMEGVPICNGFICR
jgi:hypothetical protein